MRVMGYRADTETRVAALMDAGRAVDLVGVDEFYADTAAGLGLARQCEHELAVADLELAPPVPAGARVMCVGLNYRAHAAEGGFDLPEYPAVFGRWTQSLSVTGTPVPVPSDEPGLDWEGELAVIIGKPLIDASEDEARQAFLGYAVFNDLTARRAQRHTSQWTVGKNADRSGPIGPIVTADEVPDIDAGRRLTTSVNGDVVQHAWTAEMIFTPAHVAAYLSRTFTLAPGDIIATGTPPGVGHARRPPRFLQPGDVVSVTIEDLGTISNPIVARARS